MKTITKACRYWRMKWYQNPYFEFSFSPVNFRFEFPKNEYRFRGIYLYILIFSLQISDVRIYERELFSIGFNNQKSSRGHEKIRLNHLTVFFTDIFTNGEWQFPLSFKLHYFYQRWIKHRNLSNWDF